MECVVQDAYMPNAVHPVDQALPVPKLLTLGLQHVLVMYAGAVAVPLIVGRSLKMSSEDVAFLISADLFACGLATLVQSIGFPGVGIRLPVMMGVTFASVGPMLSMAAAPDVGLLGIYGSVIGAGLFALVAAPFMSRLLPLFPPVVTGTIILVIGVSFMRSGINRAPKGPERGGWPKSRNGSLASSSSRPHDVQLSSEIDHERIRRLRAALLSICANSCMGPAGAAGCEA
jgi:xanthine/uracil permease